MTFYPENNMLLMFGVKQLEVYDLTSSNKMQYLFEYDHIDTHVVGTYFVSIFTHSKFSLYNLNDILDKTKLRYEHNGLNT